jgi:hypothetical protein
MALAVTLAVIAKRVLIEEAYDIIQPITELMMHLSQPRREGQNNAELIAEIKALRAEVRAGQAAIVSETKGTNRILRDVTQDGTAVTTVAQV